MVGQKLAIYFLEIAAHSTQKISKVLQKVPFTLTTDDNNDSDNHMYPIVVMFFFC